jgi:hypothetical protein
VRRGRRRLEAESEQLDDAFAAEDERCEDEPMIAAAAVIVLPVAARPSVTASRLSPLRCHSS